MLGAQGIRATGFKRAQGNVHCAKFESHTNRVTFETNAIRMTSSVQAQYDTFGRSSSSEIDISFQKIAKILYYYGTTCGFGNMSVSDDIDD